MGKAKPFGIAKREVWEAYKRVKANRGAAGVDDQSIEEFDGDLGSNLYRLWNRMASGSYMPSPVRRVDISKGEGKTRPLGIPTVSDRIAQAVAKRYLEDIWNPCSMTTRTDIGPAARRIKLWAWLAGAAGGTTGCLTSTSRGSTTISTMTF